MISDENLQKLFKPKTTKETIDDINALYSKGYYDSNPDTNPEYKAYLEKIRRKGEQ